MKKIILALFLFSGFVANSQNASSYTTTTSQMRFNNTDLLQIYGAMLGTYGSSTVSATDIHVKQNVTCVTTTGAYSVGECLGASASNTFTAVRSSSGTAVLNEILVADSSNQKGAIMVYFFNAAPTGTVTDNGTFQMSPDDLKNKLLGQYQILSSDYTTSGRYAVAHNYPLRELVLKPSTGTTIWFIAVIGGTYTYGASALYFRFGLKQD